MARDPRESWNALAAELESLGTEHFAAAIEAVSGYVAGEKGKRAALARFLQSTPGTRR